MKRKYSVTDSRGKVHTRTSAREYKFAVVIHWKAYPLSDGTMWPAGSHANWAAREDLARKSANQYRNNFAFDGAEIIPV